MRRPFTATPARPYTDVWHYSTVNTYPGKHLCEKPLDMMRDIIATSSRAGDVVCDPFCGSGVSLRAAWQLGRQYIGNDADSYWVQLTLDSLRLPFEKRAVIAANDVSDLPLFAAK